MTDNKYNIRKAILFGVLSALSLSVMILLVKLAVPYTNEITTVFFRFLISFLYVAFVFLAKKIRGEVFSLKTSQIGFHIGRALTSVASIFVFYYSLRYLPILDANLLAMTYPLFMALLTFVIWRAKTTLKYWAAILIGFLGVGLILKPGTEIFNFVALIGLSGGLLAALSMLGIHELGKKDKPYTIMFYYFSLTFIISGILAIFNWHHLSLYAVLILIGVGIFATIYQVLLIRALIYAPAKIASPLLYLSLVFSGIFGFAFWGQIPDWFSLAGMILVCVGCIFTVIHARSEVKK